MFEPTEIETRIRNALADADITVKDLTGGKDHFEVSVVSETFAGMTPLQRHRKVYGLFTDVMGGAIHAFSLHTRTPDETT